MTVPQDVFKDLIAEGDDVDRLVADIDALEWNLPTPAPGWTISHQIAHLTFIFRLAGTAASDPEAFKAITAAAAKDFQGALNAALAEDVAHPPDVLLARWRSQRTTATEALAAVPADQTVPWLVRPLPPAILACAGIMELFGHGQDIYDALGVEREPTDRIWHLVGFTTLVRDFGYQARGLAPPEVEFRYELTAPSGELWEIGPADATEKISGPALDLCLLATRRRHRDDLALSATGSEADHFLDIAQAYRGPAGPGRSPGQFAATAGPRR